MNFVKNLNGTSGKTCSCPGCSSWLEHWERKTGQRALLCAACGCTNFAEVGGHVIKKDGNDFSHYIVPLCKGCNNRTDAFMVYKELVSAKCDINEANT